MTISFDGQVAIVTGAGHGLGRSYAQLLAARGARVVVNNRRHEHESESSADRVVDEITVAGGTAIANYESVETEGAGRRIVDMAIDHWGSLDILISNAGVSEGLTFRKQDFDDFRRLSRINYIGTAAVTHAAWGHMHDAGYGRVLLTTSSAGVYGQHGLPGYSGSKAGIIGLTRALALEGVSRRIAVNAIAPYADTKMTTGHMPEDVAERFTSERVAPVVCWLVSEQCDLTGEVFIAGAGLLRRVRIAETISVSIDESADDAIESAGQAVRDIMGVQECHPMSDAGSEFMDMAGELHDD